MLLKRISNPTDLHALSVDELSTLSDEVRQRIIEVTIQNGGHIGASLGAVELIVSLLHVFDPDKDKIVFDVGHQAYAYKILTGRNQDFDKLRTFGGISGFPKPSESKYDHFVGGHAGNAVSAGCGYALARKMSGEDHQVISVLGDGVLVNGETAEGLNLAASSGKQIIVINDNTFSISAGVGSIPDYLKDLREKEYSAKVLTGSESPFSMYSLDYLGPIDGHDISKLTEAFRIAKAQKRSIVLHVVTSKGKGYALAEQNPLKLHGISPKGELSKEGFGGVFGNALIKLREKDDKVVAVAAAMAIGTGLSAFIDKYPNSFVDVGIAESTAVTVAAALARAGYKPYVAIYSTFLQRAYDQLLYDVALDGLDVTFLLDRAGIVGEDGESHQGIYDLALLSSVPNCVVASPATYDELEKLLSWADRTSGVKVIRYPKGGSDFAFDCDGAFPNWQMLKFGNDGYLIAHGSAMVKVASDACALLKEKGKDVGLINARFLSPIDESCLKSIADMPIYVAEDVIYEGSLSAHLSMLGYRVRSFSLPTSYVSCGKPDQIRKSYGIDANSIAEAISNEA